MLVRIPNDYIRQKILEKRIWYIGDTMFHTAQWASHHSHDTSPMVSFPVWAHLRGVPLDLRSLEGLSWVAGLIGEPKETDEFTINLTSLHLAHVKVEVDLTKTLPDVIELGRADGSVTLVEVTYPWIPPTCSHCKELGHVIRNCLKLPHASARNSSQGKPTPPPNATTVPRGPKDNPLSDPNAAAGPTHLSKAPSITTAHCHPSALVESGSELVSTPSKAGSLVMSSVLDSQLSPSVLFSTPTASLPSSLSTNSPLSISPTLIQPFVVGLPASISCSGQPYPHSPPYEPRPYLIPKKYKPKSPLPPNNTSSNPPQKPIPKSLKLSRVKQPPDASYPIATHSLDIPTNPDCESEMIVEIVVDVPTNPGKHLLQSL
ncbi:unnamed protein product [Arabis nemorensis]|uniref:Uncharacterized protein n=1 Tax=Arabis nemorensis TaxID=586526 RepID=A0A565C624_9BRAS|nr:unnamed protein product [Arabis nemorensis]